ncbi:MAG TPA: carboxypeptidase-like regulatory domain-containing protein, partial [Pyrinomonadaceae bacterium]
MKKGQMRLKVLVGMLVIFLFSFVTIFGQEFRGTITGTVTDPQGAVVPGAAVTVKNLETNVVNNVTANDEGSYTVPFLLPGRYSVSITAAGFKTSVRENVTVNVDDRLTIDVQLEIGQTADVDIVADTELVERGTVTTGTVITQRQIEELPLS